MSSLAAHSPSTATVVTTLRSKGPSTLFLSAARHPLPQEFCVCFNEGGTIRAQRVTGFWDALIQVARVEGFRGLWKGVGTTL